MNRSREYSDKLKRREPRFKALIQDPALTEKDIEQIERALKYPLPAPFKEFLLSCKMPECKMTVKFCGDYTGCFDVDGDGLYTAVETEWCAPFGDSAKEFLERAENENLNIGESASALECGFLKIAEFCGYLVFLDLATGKVVHIYHEELWEMEVVSGVDSSDKAAVRDYMLNGGLCRDFYDFLRLVCTGEIYDENEMVFKTEEELREENSREIPFEDINATKREALKQVMAEQGMTREEAAEFLAELVGITLEEFYDGLN